MADNAGSDPSDDESDPSGSDDDFDPSEVFLYTGVGSIPRNAIRVEVHRSVKEIPNHVFQFHRQLESVLLHEGLLKIARKAFWGCISLRGFTCPVTVVGIGEGAFYECSNMTTFELPEGLESIESATFHDCTSLEELQIPASVTRIGRFACRNCINLSSAKLREGLLTIGECAFEHCRSLRRLGIPSSVVEIGHGAFYGCRSLASVRLHEDLPRMKWLAFRRCPIESFLFVLIWKRMEAIRMDEQTNSIFDSRLREITRALTRSDHDDDSFLWRLEDEEETEAVREKCKESLGRAHEVLTYLELKGAAPVLELALWKRKVEGEGEEGVQVEPVNDEDRGQDQSDAVRERKRPKMVEIIGQDDTRLSRGDCRVKCGADIALSEVMKFFTYSSSWPRLGDLGDENVI